MISKWIHLKDKAISLRVKGKSIKDIESTLGIPRSTLSLWLRHVKLTNTQRKKLKAKADNALILARKKTADYHKAAKKLRIKKAENDAKMVVSTLDSDRSKKILALAMLYWGEGRKEGATSIGSTDPLLLKFVLAVMQECFDIRDNTFRCYIHGRADQSEKELISYWSKVLQLDKSRFGKVVLDQRTRQRSTFKNYYGVCSIEFGRIDIQRQLKFVYNEYSRDTIKRWTRSSVG